MKKIQDYPNETNRNKAKTDRRRADLLAIAQAAGWGSWSGFETAVRRGEVAIPPKALPPHV